VISTRCRAKAGRSAASDGCASGSQQKDRKNPAAVAKASSGRPCSNASGIRVSASEASTAPPAKASAIANTCSLSCSATARPSTTAAASTTAQAIQVSVTERVRWPARRVDTGRQRLGKVGEEDRHEQ
jgi:hypothetical protein